MTIEQLEELERAATPGLWHWRKTLDGWWLVGEDDLLILSLDCESLFPDVAAIPEFRNAAPALLRLWRAAASERAIHGMACTCLICDALAELDALGVER